MTGIYLRFKTVWNGGSRVWTGRPSNLFSTAEGNKVEFSNTMVYRNNIPRILESQKSVLQVREQRPRRRLVSRQLWWVLTFLCCQRSSLHMFERIQVQENLSTVKLDPVAECSYFALVDDSTSGWQRADGHIVPDRVWLQKIRRALNEEHVENEWRMKHMMSSVPSEHGESYS